MIARQPLLVLGFTIAAALTLTACTPAAAPSTDAPPAATPTPDASDRTNPDAPVGAQPPLDPDPGAGDGALHVQPEPGIVDAIPHAWDRISIAPDGRTLTVYYWGGVEACYGLDRVEVEAGADGQPVIRVFEGRRGNLAPDTACIEIAMSKAVTVELDEPIVAPAQ